MTTEAVESEPKELQQEKPPQEQERPPSPPALPTAIEFEPPLACVRRILKNTLPASTNVGKDASAAFARSAGIFIIYVTACANDFARENRRQTITANDVLAAVKELDFEEFTPKLTEFLESYRAAEKRKKDAKAKARAAEEAANDESNKMGTPQSFSKGDKPEGEIKADSQEKNDESTEEEGDVATEEEDNVVGQEERGEDVEHVAKKRKLSEDQESKVS